MYPLKKKFKFIAHTYTEGSKIFNFNAIVIISNQ